MYIILMRTCALFRHRPDVPPISHSLLPCGTPACGHFQAVVEAPYLSVRLSVLRLINPTIRRPVLGWAIGLWFVQITWVWERVIAIHCARAQSKSCMNIFVPWKYWLCRIKIADIKLIYRAGPWHTMQRTGSHCEARVVGAAHRAGVAC